MKSTGKIYLIPAPLGEDAPFSVPLEVIEILHRLDHLVVEKAKTARHFIKRTNPPKPLNTFVINELNEHTPASELPALLQPALDGNDLGLLSEAGCPGVADPGAGLVELAHEKGVEVVPLVGASSILLALMASGMNGQRFSFHGYLAAKPDALARDLKKLEQLSGRENQTQIFIETPYRNRQVFEQALRTLQSDTLFCIACDLTLPSQFIATKKISAWQKAPPPDLQKRPTVFLIYGRKH